MAPAVEQRRSVPRQRLLRVLERRFDCRLTLVEAGAGFGKTSLIRQAMNEARLFHRSREFLFAPERLRGGDKRSVVEVIADLLGSEATVAAVSDAMLAASPLDVVVWLDDVQRVDIDMTELGHLIEALPRNGHIVLVGRRLPTLPIARLVVDDDVLLVDEEELRFDGDERAAFYQLRGAGETTSSSDGWPALMELELRVGRSGAIDYLTEEVLGATSREQVAALSRLSLLDRFDDGMIRAVTDFNGPIDAIISGVPLIHVTESDGPDGDEVEVHDLLRDALGGMLSESEKIDATRAIANELFARRDLTAAVQRFAAIDDDEGVERVAEQLIDDLHFASAVGDRTEAVEIVLAQLGDAPAALALRAVTLFIVDPAHSEPALLEALAAARDAGRADLEGVALVRLAEASYNRGDAASLVEYRSVLDGLAVQGGAVAKRLGTLVDLWIHRLTGRTHEIADFVDRCFEDGAIADPEMEAVALFYRTMSLAYSGRVRDAIAAAEGTLRRLPPGLFTDRFGGFLAIQRWMLGEQTTDDRVAVSQLVDQIERRGQAHLFAEGAGTVAIFFAAAGDVAKASELVGRAERITHTLPAGAWARHTIAQARAAVEVLNGDEAAAAEHLETAIPPGGPMAGLPSHIYDLTAPLSYLLVPRTRALWDADHVQPDLTVRTAVGRALVAFRERGETGPAAELDWDCAHTLRPWALEPHLVELAVAAAAGGVSNAMSVLTDLRHDPLETLARLAESPKHEIAAAAGAAIRITPRRPSERIELAVLGPMRVARGGLDESSAGQWRRAAVRRLLGLLIARRRLLRIDAARMLWPDKDDDAGMNNLRVTLSRLLAALEPERESSSPSWFVRVVGDHLVLVESHLLDIDVDRFRAHVASGRRLDGSAPRDALVEHLAACEIYQGDYLSGLDLDDDTYLEALHLRGEFVASSTRAADLLLSIGEADRAEAVALRATATEPLNETVRHVLVRSLLAQRRVDAAGDVVRDLLEQLEQVQIPPEPETVHLAERLAVVVSDS